MHPSITRGSSEPRSNDIDNAKNTKTTVNETNHAAAASNGTTTLTPEDIARKWIRFHGILKENVPAQLHTMCFRIMLDIGPELGMPWLWSLWRSQDTMKSEEETEQRRDPEKQVAEQPSIPESLYEKQ